MAVEQLVTQEFN